MTPIVSVIMPVYNGENNILESLNSLINQTYSNFEVVIIDDGSGDNTPEVIDRYVNKDKRFKYTYQDNAGVAAARNKGLELAKGNYICFLDSDDLYEKDYIEKLVTKIKGEAADVCYCGYNIIKQNKIIEKRTKFKEQDVLLGYILGNINIHTTGWMIKKSLLEQNNILFSKGVSWGEDIEFFCEVLAEAEKITCVKEYLTNYRIDFDENQLSAYSIDKMDKDYESIKRIQKNTSINTSDQINNALMDYRLSALLTYRLLEAIRRKEDREIIIKYYNKYKNHMIKFTWNNGLRSIKLNLNKLYLKYMIKKII